jgi:hypothetical protein
VLYYLVMLGPPPIHPGPLWPSAKHGEERSYLAQNIKKKTSPPPKFSVNLLSGRRALPT